MGNNSTREARPESHRGDSGTTSGPTSPTDRHHPQAPYNSRSGRGSRPDLSSILGLGSSNSNNDVPERRETKQEREARKLEKERVNRIKEREHSIKEEHVDGGYLVTMGVYTGHEDFNKSVVRQLMVERRLAPFWRGLEDFRDEWTEYQLVAAGRGIPIPAADEIPPEGIMRSLSMESGYITNSNIQNLMVPIAGRSHSASSDVSSNLSPSHPAFSVPSPTSSAPPPAPSNSPFRPRSKTVASLTTSSKDNPTTDLAPREIQLPNDPFVNGQQIEVFLYKDASECPICFLYYPPYLNKTRCCDQAICSECFVQIKRPDPHPPEHETSNPANPIPQPPEGAPEPEQLVSEPSTCPYCQQTEFGVIYEAPPFRRGLSYTSPAHGLHSLSSAMSSSSSLNSTSGVAAATNAHKRRTTSISANAPTVITTDRIRPDWATKLANARNHLARRAAAATALHTAAYMMNGNTENRSFGFGSRSRFGRHRGDNSPGTSGAATPSSATAGSEGGPRTVAEQVAQMRREVQEGGGSRRRNRMEDLEEMMMLEAIRLSLAAEEEQNKKREKEAAKEAKKRAKEDKKREKKERKVYGSGASSSNGSALSLSLPGLGRRRGNSGASHLGREITPENVNPSDPKGKGVDRVVNTPSSFSATSYPLDISRQEASSNPDIPGTRHLDTATLSAMSDLYQPSPSPTAPDKPSHLRQMSNASSPASSFVESTGSARKGSNISNSRRHSDDTPDGEESEGNPDLEPMFNFQSLAAMIGAEDGDEDDKQDAAKHIEHLNGGKSSDRRFAGDDETSALAESMATIRVNNSNSNNGPKSSQESGPTTLLESQHSTPEVKLTPETPAALDDRAEEDKQLGAGWTEQVTREITQ